MKEQLRVIKATLKGFNVTGISDNDGEEIFEEVKIENLPEMKTRVPRSEMHSKYWTR